MSLFFTSLLWTQFGIVCLFLNWLGSHFKVTLETAMLIKKGYFINFLVEQEIVQT